MYIVTYKERPIKLQEIRALEGNPQVYLGALELDKLQKYIMSTTRQHVLKEFLRIFRYAWNRRNKTITLHKFNDFGRLIEDVTDTGDWQQRKRDRAEAKRIAAKVRKSRLY